MNLYLLLRFLNSDENGIGSMRDDQEFGIIKVIPYLLQTISEYIQVIDRVSNHTISGQLLSNSVLSPF